MSVQDLLVEFNRHCQRTGEQFEFEFSKYDDQNVCTMVSSKTGLTYSYYDTTKQKAKNACKVKFVTDKYVGLIVPTVCGDDNNSEYGFAEPTDFDDDNDNCDNLFESIFTRMSHLEDELSVMRKELHRVFYAFDNKNKDF